jgi:hypothetical protein
MTSALLDAVLSAKTCKIGRDQFLRKYKYEMTVHNNVHVVTQYFEFDNCSLQREKKLAEKGELERHRKSRQNFNSYDKIVGNLQQLTEHRIDVQYKYC